MATFQTDLHLYRDDDGAIVPLSVTQALRLCGYGPEEGSYAVRTGIVEKARKRGEAVDYATVLIDRDDLDESSVDPQIAGYLLAWQRFKEAEEFEVQDIQKPGIGISDGLKYGYKIDRVGLLKGQKAIVDIKCTYDTEEEWSIQTAGYDEGEGGGHIRAVAHLHKDGKYTPLHKKDGSQNSKVFHSNVSDYGDWKACLRIAYRKLAHGAKLK